MKRSCLALSFVILAGCAAQTALPPGEPAFTALSGVVTDIDGRPVENAYVYLYADGNTHFFGPPDHLSRPTDAEGRYSIDIPSGTYYVFARKRKSGSYQGPLYKDDLFGDSDGRLTNLIAGNRVLKLVMRKLEGSQFYRPEKVMATTSTMVTGRITDETGKPVFGAFAFAYRDKFEKQSPPHYGSFASDTDGRYRLYLDEGGGYVIGARIKAKEPPVQGEPVGFYGDSNTSVLTIATGQTLENINIVVSPFAGSPGMKPVFIPLQR